MYEQERASGMTALRKYIQLTRIYENRRYTRSGYIYIYEAICYIYIYLNIDEEGPQFYFSPVIAQAVTSPARS